MQRTKFQILWHLGRFSSMPHPRCRPVLGEEPAQAPPRLQRLPSLFYRVSVPHGGHPCSVASDRVAPKGGPGRRRGNSESEHPLLPSPALPASSRQPPQAAAHPGVPALPPSTKPGMGNGVPVTSPAHCMHFPWLFCPRYRVCAQSLRRAPLSATPWTVVCQATWEVPSPYLA